VANTWHCFSLHPRQEHPPIPTLFNLRVYQFNGTLGFFPISDEDSGTYTCTATNIAGSKQCEVTVLCRCDHVAAMAHSQFRNLQAPSRHSPDALFVPFCDTLLSLISYSWCQWYNPSQHLSQKGCSKHWYPWHPIGPTTPEWPWLVHSTFQRVRTKNLNVVIEQ